MLIDIFKLQNNKGQVPGVPKNPRTIKDNKYELLKKSLQDDPDFMNYNPILLYDFNGKLIVMGGNMRVTAARELGWKQIEGNIMPAETPPEVIKARIIKHNNNYGSDDWDLIANEWSDVPLTDFGLDVPYYHDVNDLSDEDFSEFNDIIADGNIYKLIIAFKTEDKLKKFMKDNQIKLDNNYKRVGKVISINWPLTKKNDLKNVEFK